MSNTVIYVGLDDTDNQQSGGTGCLARLIASQLDDSNQVLGVTRHQLLVDPRIPYTKNNSCASIILRGDGATDMLYLLEQVWSMVLAGSQPGSDPGLCITTQEKALNLVDFGKLAQCELVKQDHARSLAASENTLLVGIGGSQDGIIGALAAAGLAASSDDERYILIGRIRELSGLQPIYLLIEAGINQVRTTDGRLVQEGLVLCDKLRPSRRGGLPVLFVERNQDACIPIKLD